MKLLLQFSASLLCLALALAAGILVADLHQMQVHALHLLDDSDLAARHAYASLSALDAATINLADTLHEVQGTAQNLKGASAAETQYWNATAKQTSDAARDMRQLIARTDRELNDHVLPDFDRELVATSTAAQFSFESVTHAGDALTFQINDPEIGQTLHGLNMAANNFSSAAANGSSILAHGDHVAAYYDKKLTTPLGFWKTLGKTALSVGSQAGNISAGFVK